jgi:hypothetical protein
MADYGRRGNVGWTPPAGHHVRIVSEPADGPALPLGDLLAALDRLPANPDWPDGAAEHDHHVYGTSKAV